MKKFALFAVVLTLSVAVGTLVAPHLLRAQQQGQLGTRLRPRPCSTRPSRREGRPDQGALRCSTTEKAALKTVTCIHSASTAAMDCRRDTSEELIGTDVRALKDKTGKPLVKSSTERRRKRRSPRLATCFRVSGSDTTPVEKISFVTKVGDLGCGVGYTNRRSDLTPRDPCTASAPRSDRLFVVTDTAA